MLPLLACFRHHSVLWVLLLSAWDLLMNGLSVSASGGGGPWEHQRTPSPVLAPCRNGTTWSLYRAKCSWFSVQHKHPPKESVGASRNWGKALKYKTILWRCLSSPEFTVQPCHFICPSHRWSSCNPRIICELCQFTQQMPARNSEITSPSLLNSVLLSPLKTLPPVLKSYYKDYFV